MTKFGSELIHLVSTDSTNNYVANLIEQGRCKDGSVIMADYQSKGKGQRGNLWQSVSKSNLLFSLAFKPQYSIDEQIRLAWFSALMWQQCLRRFGIEIQIKWPNDLYINGKKIGGLLIEQQLREQHIEWSILGCGINVNAAPKLPNTTSIFEQTNKKFLPLSILGEYLDLLNGQQALLNGQFDKLKNLFESELWLRGEYHLFQLPNGTEFNGLIVGISDCGKLRIEHKGQISEFDNQQIKFCLP